MTFSFAVSAPVLLLVASQALAVSQPSAPVETLADGNLRDARPDAAQLKALVETSRRQMIFLPGGSFEMGDWGAQVNQGGLPFDGEPDSKPLHKVTLAGFSMGKYPVTYAQFDLFTAAAGLPRINQQTVYQRYRKPDNPAGVSWQGAKDYCLWLGQQAKLPVDLATEAQWEYAARSGGKRHLYPTDNGQLEPGRNIATLAQRDAAGGLLAVGSLPPNPAGFHDFGAALREWTGDWYGADYYAVSPASNPTGPASGSERVVRGNFGDTEMTFRRWHRPAGERSGGWTSYSATPGGAKKQVPYTKYSGNADSAFRCVVNRDSALVQD